MKKIEQEDKEDEENGIPPRFGYPHKVNYNLDNSGEWVVLPNGDKLWRLAISCQNALSINLLYDKFWLPDGAKFFVYSNDRKQTIGAMTSINNKGDKSNIQGFATGLVYGENTTLEYYLPKNLKEKGIISVSNVVHGYRYISMKATGYGGSGSCNINVNCSQGQNWQNEKNAVAMIVVGGDRWCSGALVNTTANDGRPMFLTANHCLTGGANAINAPNLNNWSFYWHYESLNCANAVPATRSTIGADVVANNIVSDFALLRLMEDPRNATGVTPYYLGWDRSGNTGTGGVGIHHPRGDIKKISIYTMTPVSDLYLSSSGMANSHWRTIWSSGTTEGGSSGSPIINNSRRVIGQLHGGYADCIEYTDANGHQHGPNEPDWYGKFSVSWTGGGTNATRLSNWLDSLNTGVSVLDGCHGVQNYANPAVTGNITVVGCENLNVQNTTVTSTGTLNLQAGNTVNINPPFTVNTGGTLTIQVP